MAMTAIDPGSSSGSEDEEKPGYFGLDDSDMDEWLESSSEGSLKALAVAQPPQLSRVLTATVWRGARESPGGDACRPVPPTGVGNTKTPLMPVNLSNQPHHQHLFDLTHI